MAAGQRAKERLEHIQNVARLVAYRQGPQRVGYCRWLYAAKRILRASPSPREREEERTLVAAEAEKSVMPVEGDRAVVLSVHEECGGCDFGSGGALGRIPEEGATEAAAAKVLISCEPAQARGGHARIPGQPAGCCIRQVAQEHGAHRERVVACDRTRLTLQRDAAGAHPPTDVLPDLAVKVTVERLYSAVEGVALVMRREPLDNEGAAHR